MTTTRSNVSSRRRRPPARLRLLALAAAPLALIGATVTPVAAPHRTVATLASQPGTRLRTLPLPGLGATSYKVTLITGAQVILQRMGNDHYVARAIPSPDADSTLNIMAQGGVTGVTSLEAVPADARALISSGEVSPGLFDVLYLARHDDTGQAARIPVIIQYAGASAAALVRLPGVTLLARPAGDEIEVGVTASHAAAFWAALTGQAAAVPGTAHPAGLADGADRIWLADHDTSASAHPQPQRGQPLFLVTETITRSIGPVQEGQCGYAAVRLGCLQEGLWELTGSSPTAGFSPMETCAKLVPAKPQPVCDAFKFSYRVPAGEYYAVGDGTFLTTTDSDHTLEQATVETDVPQFTVAGPTRISLDANDAEPVTVTAPRLTSSYGAPDDMESYRDLPDGQWVSNVDQSPYGGNNWWAVPTAPGQGATIGNYTFTTDVTLGRPPVTADLTTPAHLTLHLLYPMYAAGYPNSLARPNRFEGRHTLSLVDAGEGTAADFSKIDARGKLALIRTRSNWVLPQQLINAVHAGAAGVLVDAGTQPGGYLNYLPVYTYTNSAGPKVPRDMPFAEIDAQQASTVIWMLAHGGAHITIADSGPSPYLYYLSFSQESRIPGSLHYNVSSRQLAGIDDSYHSTSPVPVGQSPAVFRPNVFYTGGSAAVIDGPATVHEYYGPLSPDTVWWLDSVIPYSSKTPPPPTPLVFDRPANSTLAWNEPPITLGSVTLGAPNQAQPGDYWVFCAGCRQGNVFFPIFWLVNGANPNGQVQAVGFEPGAAHLYNRVGRAVPPTMLDGVVSYKLAPQPSWYRLVTKDGGMSTIWRFSSAAPRVDQALPGTLCLGTVAGTSTAPCAPAPLVFIRYNAFTHLNNSVTAPGMHPITVTVYHEDPSAPPIASLTLWISTDGGGRWQLLRTVRRGDSYHAFYSLPPMSSTNGYVSLKAQAFDTVGDTVSQTILNAYPLSKPTG